jgi:hypothetical protein
MTIQCVFQQGSERMAIRIIGSNVLFIDLQNNIVAPLEGLKLNKKGVEKEYPDLKGDSDWKQKAIQRFVNKIKNFKTEEERSNWLIEEMKSMGYTPLYKIRSGFRPQKIK